jgi:hypothetical protein
VFSLDLAGGMEGRYHECEECHLLQSFHLDELAPEELGPIYDPEKWVQDPDPGASWRLSYVGRRLELLAKTRMFPRRSDAKMLDFGSGSSFIVAYLAHRLGTEAWGYEPYATPVFAPERTLRTWEEVLDRGPYQLVIASEVFEHFIKPHEEIVALKESLEDRSALFITTGRYVPGKHGPDWAYLAPHAGQHVAFYSEESMQKVARILGYSHVYCVGGPNEWLLTSPGSDRARLRMAVAALLMRVGSRFGFPGRIDRS